MCIMESLQFSTAGLDSSGFLSCCPFSLQLEPAAFTSAGARAGLLS